MFARLQITFDECQPRRIAEQKVAPATRMAWRGLAQQLEDKLVAFDRAIAQIRDERDPSRAELSERWPSSGWRGTPAPREQINAILREAFPLPLGGSFELLRTID